MSNEHYQEQIKELITEPKDLPLSQNLLNFYKAKCESFEKERAEMIELVNSYKLEHKKYHDLMYELRRREEEIKKLQEALRNAQGYVFKERELRLEIQRENDCLRIQEAEDRKKIRELLIMTQPVQQEVTYFKDMKPESISRLSIKAQNMTNIGRPLHDRDHKAAAPGCKSNKRKLEFRIPRAPSNTGRGGGESSACQTKQPKRQQPMIVEDPGTIVIEDSAGDMEPRGAAPQPQANPQIPNGAKQQGSADYVHPSKSNSKTRIMRTVFLPNEKVDSLLLNIESLKATLEEQKRISAEREEQFEKERELARQEEETRSEADRATIGKLQQELKEREELLAKMTREYLVVRNNHSVSERVLMEENERLKMENDMLQLQMQEMTQQFKREAKIIVLSAREQSDEYASHFRNQAIERENQIMQLQRELSTVRADFEIRAKNLENRVQKLKSERDEVARRRRLEWEGYRNDILLMKKHIKKLEDQLQKLASFQLLPPEFFDGDVIHFREEIENELHAINRRLIELDKEMRRSGMNGIKT